MGGNASSSPDQSKSILKEINRFILYIRFASPYQLSKWVLYHILRKFFLLLRNFWWLLRGVAWTKWMSKKKKNFESSAHVQTIIYRYKCDPVLETSGELNFVTIHDSFVRPSYVLQDNVSLYYVTETEAGFVEVDPSVDVTSSDTGCFMRLNQFTHARKLITMPLSSFHQVAACVGEPQAQLIFLNNTTRCGSTVLCQMFEESGHCLAMSEPDALNVITYFDRHLPQDDVVQMLRSCVRLLCKPRAHKTYEAYLMKTTAPGIWGSPLFNKVYPDAKLLFMYRDGIKVAESLSKASIRMPILRFIYLFNTERMLLALKKKYWDYETKFPDHPGLIVDTMFSACFYTWASVMGKYQQLWSRGYDMPAVKYEHLISNPQHNMELILKHCGLPQSWAKPAMRALRRDSQRNSPLSMDVLGTLQDYGLKYSDVDKKTCEIICIVKKLSYEPGKPWSVDGTLSEPAEIENYRQD